MNKREFIASRAAAMLEDGDLVNLGIGMPTLVSDYLPEGVDIILQSENGCILMGPAPEAGKEDKDIINAGSEPATLLPGAAVFDVLTSFTMIRGGHMDATVLGALQVDEQRNIASWWIPGQKLSGVGGAMDLIIGARKVIVVMEHTMRDGTPKILKKCTYPLTAVGKIDYIVTELCTIHCTDSGLEVMELVPGVSFEQVQAVTEARLTLNI